MNEVELLIPGELCLHLHLPINVLDLLESLEKNIPTLINASDDQGRKLLIECVRTEDLVTIKVISGNDDILSPGWTCSVSDIMSQYQQISSPSLPLDFTNQAGEGLVTSVVIKDERNCEENGSFVLGMVNDYLKPVEGYELVPSAEELLVEETVFANDCNVTTCSTSEMHIDLAEQPEANLLPPVNGIIHLPSSSLESLANDMNMYNTEPWPVTKVDCSILQPKVISDLLIFRCSLCHLEYLKEETGQKHLRRHHSHSDATLVTDVAKTTYVCTVCSQPFRDCYRWQLHMKIVHSVFVDGRLKPFAKFENFSRRHLVPWQIHKFEPIQCLVCQSQMHLSESYYLHIRRHHRSDPQYKAAMRHLLQVRETRLRKKCKMSIQCFKCDEVLTEYTIISHLRVVHATDPCLNEMIATTKLCIKNKMKSQSLANQKVKTHCQFCKKEMRNSTLKSHLEFHCPALIAVIPNGEIKQEVLESAAKNGAEAVLVRMPRTTVCQLCSKTMTLKAFYHHQRRVHEIGINNAKTYSCSYCKKTFWDHYHLQNHLLIHTRDRAFVCLVCSHSFINMASYAEHHRKVHERQFLHSCSACGRGFWKRVDKIRHSCKPQDLSINQLKNARLAARAKAIMEKWEGPFYLEMERSEALKFTKNATNSIHHLKQNNLKDKKKLVCIICKKSFQSIRYFQSHLRYSHLQDYDLICERCGLGFWNVTQMTSHKCDPSKHSFNLKKRHLLATKAKEMLKHIPRPYYHVLGVTETSSNYPNLIKIDLDCSKDPCQTADETGTETVNCLGKETVIPDFGNDLKLTDVENLQCRKQDNCLVRKTSALSQGQCNYTLCSICGKEIKLKNYYPHMRRVHCDDSHKPIVWKICNQCGYRCQDNYKFRRHSLTHNKNAAGIPCELCSRLSYELVDYNHHFKHRHLGQFNIRCDLCGKGFWKINALQSHVCYPELKEENLRIQKLKAEAAIKKRDAVRKATGMNSNVVANEKKQNQYQKNMVKKRSSGPEKQNCHNKQKSSTNKNSKNKISKKEKERILGQQSKCTNLEKQTDSSDNNTSQVTTISEYNVISETSLIDLAETADEIQRHLHFKDNLSEENVNETADVQSQTINQSTTVYLSANTKARKQSCVTELKLFESVRAKMSKIQKLNKQELPVFACSQTENVHQYGTRKRQVSFRALLGKK